MKRPLEHEFYGFVKRDKPKTCWRCLGMNCIVENKKFKEHVGCSL